MHGRWLPLACSALSACGGLTIDPVDAGGTDAGAATVEAGVVDAGAVAVDASAPRREAGACPGRRPVEGTGCDAADEGRGCVFGESCRAECVCERGSWVCASDSCASSCPQRIVPDSVCAASDIDRVCVLSGWCAPSCTCDGAAWRCVRRPC